MMDETLFHQGTIVVRRLRLAPGEACRGIAIHFIE
jgi:hypothetical protein